MKRVAIYLAGNIQKGHEQLNENYWSESEITCIANILKPIRVDFLNPAIRTDDLSDQKAVFGRDMTQVYCSNVVFVDARQRRGLGVGAEMMWAKINKIPVITLCPQESHYQKDKVNLLGAHLENWIHPFVYSLSDKIVATVEEGAQWIDLSIVKKDLIIEVKGAEFIKEAMAHYHNTQYLNDIPMQSLTRDNPDIYERLHQ